MHSAVDDRSCAQSAPIVAASWSENSGFERGAIGTHRHRTHSQTGLTFDVVGRPKQSNQANPPIAQFFAISPGYFNALRIPVLAGRSFTEADVANGAPVMVVDEKLARRLGRVEDAVGQQIKVTDVGQRVYDHRRRSHGARPPPRRFAGVARQFYLPTYIDPPRSMRFRRS